MASQNGAPLITVELADGVQLSGNTLKEAVRNAIEFSVIGLQMLPQIEQREIKANMMSRYLIMDWFARHH